MWIAFLGALLDPLVLGTTLLALLLVKSAMQLRIIVVTVAATASLSELIGGLEEPLLPILLNAAGAALGGLLIAEVARMSLAPIAAGLLGLLLATIGWARRNR